MNEMSYLKLRGMGYGIVDSLRRSLDYWFERLLPIHYVETIEENIEENISELERVVVNGYSPRLLIKEGKEAKEVYLGIIMASLDSTLYHNKESFSLKHLARYKKVIENVVERYPRV